MASSTHNYRRGEILIFVRRGWTGRVSFQDRSGSSGCSDPKNEYLVEEQQFSITSTFSFSIYLRFLPILYIRGQQAAVCYSINSTRSQFWHLNYYKLIKNKGQNPSLLNKPGKCIPCHTGCHVVHIIPYAYYRG